MRALLCPFLAFAGLLTAHAEEGFGFKTLPQFPASKAEIVWAAPITRTNLTVYKVVPQEYPAEIISNLLSLGPFTQADKYEDSPVIRYRTKDKERYLNIVPANGWIRYWDNKADSIYKRNIEGVPTDEQAEAMAVELLGRIGIARSNLATRGSSQRLLTFGKKGTAEQFDKQKGVVVTNIFKRGVYFVRSIDGIALAGIGTQGGCEVTFSLGGKLCFLEILWPKLEPYENRKIATPEQFRDIIRAGKALMTHRDAINPKQVRQLTVTELAPFYKGAPYFERQDFIYPFAQLETVADVGRSNSPLQLYTPIFAK